MAKKSKKYEDSHFEEHLETQTIVNVDIEKRMKDIEENIKELEENKRKEKEI